MAEALNQKETIDKVQEMVRENEGRDISKADVESVLKNYGAVVISQCADKSEVTLPGVGKFKGTKRNASNARNPHTGETIAIPEKIVGKFSFGASAKRLINAE